MSTRRPGVSRRAGHTLVELMTVAVILVVLAGFSAPSFRRAVEQTKADIAGANLRAIWAAERLYWLKNRSYTANYAALRGQTEGSEPLLDPRIPFQDSEVDGAHPSPYLYTITEATTTTLTVKAIRWSYQNTTWNGVLVINQDGEFVDTTHNYVTDGNPAVQIVPGFR